MPVYRLNCECGLTHDQFLQQDKDSVIIPCPRCRRSMTWRQVRNSAITIKEKNEVRGIFNEKNKQ